MATQKTAMQQFADMVAISVDPPSESRKLDELLDKAFPLLRDENLRVVRAYGMEHNMGGDIVGNMGYAIIDRSGLVREVKIDSLFGNHADRILETLRRL